MTHERNDSAADHSQTANGMQAIYADLLDGFSGELDESPPDDSFGLNGDHQSNQERDRHKQALVVPCSENTGHPSGDPKDLVLPHHLLLQEEDSLEELLDRCGFRHVNIWRIVDRGAHTPPTVTNIRMRLERLVEAARPGDVLVLEFIGHAGSQSVSERENYGAATMPGVTAGEPYCFYLQGVSMEVIVPNQEVHAIGGSGRVVKGYGISDSTTHLLAVKVSQDLEIVDRELAMWRSVRHNNLLQLLGVHVISTGLPWTKTFLFVSPFMQNGNLSEYLARDMYANRLLILSDVANALTYLHDHARVVHGDIKPENVLIADDERAVLADFGLSTTVSAGPNRTARHIRERYTPAYSAPEIVDDAAEDPSAPGIRRSKTRMSDVYAFGMLVYEIYSDRIAVGKWYRMLGDIYDGKLPPRPVDTPPARVLCDDLWSICTRCMGVQPSERPTAAAIYLALCELRNSPARQ